MTTFAYIIISTYIASLTLLIIWIYYLFTEPKFTTLELEHTWMKANPNWTELKAGFDQYCAEIKAANGGKFPSDMAKEEEDMNESKYGHTSIELKPEQMPLHSCAMFEEMMEAANRRPLHFKRVANEIKGFRIENGEILPIEDHHLGKFETACGKVMDLRKPDPALINVTDIAIGLSRIVRFGGQIVLPYTVAHHSIIMSFMVPERFAMHALMHDAQEAYIGDVIKPLKNILAPIYAPIEEAWEMAIAQRMSLTWTAEAIANIKKYDGILLKIEHEEIRKGKDISELFKDYFESEWYTLNLLSFYDAHRTKSAFIARFNQLAIDSDKLTFE